MTGGSAPDFSAFQAAKFRTPFPRRPDPDAFLRRELLDGALL